jgi:uncharacterized protein (DUF736 family)
MRTLSPSGKCEIVPVTKALDKGPDYRVLAGVNETGAIRKPQWKLKRERLLVRADDPVFQRPWRYLYDVPKRSPGTFYLFFLSSA